MAKLVSIDLELSDDLTVLQLESLKQTFENRLEAAEKTRADFVKKRDAAQKALDFAVQTKDDVQTDLNTILERLTKQR